MNPIQIQIRLKTSGNHIEYVVNKVTYRVPFNFYESVYIMQTPITKHTVRGEKAILSPDDEISITNQVYSILKYNSIASNSVLLDQ